MRHINSKLRSHLHQIMSNTVDNEGRIQKLMHLRRGKKGAITKRIAKLQQHMNDGLSRTKIKFLLTALYECVRLLTVDCDELFSLMTEPDVEWLEEVKSSVDECAADVTAYLDQHKDEFHRQLGSTACTYGTGFWWN